MSESNSGPFKRISMPWFPFSVPATVLAAAALLIFHGVCALVALASSEFEAAAEVRNLFVMQLASVTRSLSLVGPWSWRWPFFVVSASVLVLWAYFGIAICRCLALRLARDEYLGVRDALSFARTKFGTALLFPLIVAGCILVLAAANALIGSLMQIPVVGIVFHLFLPFAYVLTGLMLIIFFSALFGGGMVSGAIAVECRGTLDAWGKALNYTFARPLHLIVYVVLLKVFLVDFLLGFGLGQRLLHAWTRTSLSPLWTNTDFENDLDGRGDGFLSDATHHVWSFFGDLAALGLAAVVLAFAFGGFTAMFLILRKDVDGIDVTEIELTVPAETLPRMVVEDGEGAGA